MAQQSHQETPILEVCTKAVEDLVDRCLEVKKCRQRVLVVSKPFQEVIKGVCVYPGTGRIVEEAPWCWFDAILCQEKRSGMICFVRCEK